MADRASSTSRRALLAGLTVTPLVSVPAAARTPHPDAELLAMDAELARLARAAERTHDVECAREERALRLAREHLDDWAHPPAHPEFKEVWRRCKLEVGLAEAERVHLRAHKALRAALVRLVAIEATTLDGLVFKTRHGQDWDIVRDSILADLVALDAARPAAA